jgi:peroxiredoxin
METPGIRAHYNSGRDRVAGAEQRIIRSQYMSISVGDRMPEGSFGVMASDGPGSISSGELFADQVVVLFAVPGAFTPTCSMNHLPGYIENADAFFDKGVGTIACMSVNDLFVMDAWGKDRGTGEKIMMLADGNGDYTKALGLELDASGFGMGKRSQRFAIVVDDGVVTQLHVEAPKEFKVSAAEAVLENL